MTELLTRLLALAELAVDEALQFEYGDPEARHIWRELQELKPLVQQALEQPEPQVLDDDEIDEEAAAVIPWLLDAAGQAANSGAPYAAGKLTLAAQLLGERRPAIKPVPVRERPWEREGWCDAEGRCWWGRIEGNPANPEWFLAGLPEIEEFYEIGDWVVLLPHHALPVPQP